MKKKMALIKENLDEPEMLEIIEEPANNASPGDEIELKDKIGNPEEENMASDNNDNNDKK